jgi:arsenate reductase
MANDPWNVLVLCTGNSARSVLAEALLRARGGGRIASWSAGSRPSGRVNPLALETLTAHGLPSDGFRSKSWDEFAGAGSPQMSLVVTVCDSAAGEACPLWPGAPAKAHWGVPDPAAVEGDLALRRAAFEAAFAALDARVRALVALPFDTMERIALDEALARIGRLPGGSA